MPGGGRAVMLSWEATESLGQHKYFGEWRFDRPLNVGFIDPSLGIIRIYMHLDKQADIDRMSEIGRNRIHHEPNQNKADG